MTAHCKEQIPICSLLPLGSPEPNPAIVRNLTGLLGLRLDQIELDSHMRQMDEAARREMELDDALDRLLDEIVDRLGFPFAAICLVDKKRDEIRSIRPQEAIVINVRRFF